MSYTNGTQIWVCPKGSRHFFKDMRAKSKTAGPPWRFFMRCVKCTAILQQIISEKTDAEGNIKPVVTAYIITAAGAIQPIKSEVAKTQPVET